MHQTCAPLFIVTLNPDTLTDHGSLFIVVPFSVVPSGYKNLSAVADRALLPALAPIDTTLFNLLIARPPLRSECLEQRHR